MQVGIFKNDIYTYARIDRVTFCSWNIASGDNVFSSPNVYNKKIKKLEEVKNTDI